MDMIIVFSGHRNATCETQNLDTLLSEFPNAIWHHGGAKGFDTQVANYAAAHGIDTVVHKPDYPRFGRGAPLRRNDDMLSIADILVACYDGRKSGGTFYTINKAKMANIRTTILHPSMSKQSE